MKRYRMNELQDDSDIAPNCATNGSSSSKLKSNEAASSTQTNNYHSNGMYCEYLNIIMIMLILLICQFCRARRGVINWKYDNFKLEFIYNNKRSFSMFYKIFRSRYTCNADKNVKNRNRMLLFGRFKNSQDETILVWLLALCSGVHHTCTACCVCFFFRVYLQVSNAKIIRLIDVHKKTLKQQQQHYLQQQ